MDLHKFRQAALQRPTAEVELPELKTFLFGEEEKPVLLVRGLTFNEQFLAREHLQKNSVLAAIKSAFDKAAGGDTKDLETIVERAFGSVLDKRTAGETAYRIEIVLRGTVGPQDKPIFQRQDVVKLADHFPIQFHTLSTKILELSGDPSNLGEQSNGSGQMTVSVLQ